MHYFLKEKCTLAFPGKDDEIVENCMAACALSLSVVLAGSGDLKTFKLLRSEFSPGVSIFIFCSFFFRNLYKLLFVTGLLKRVPISEPLTAPDEVVVGPPIVGYGSYSALSLALGFLFLSGGEQTFDTTKDAGKLSIIMQTNPVLTSYMLLLSNWRNRLFAAAYLVISLFPHLPTSSWDNRYYLQVSVELK